MEMDEERKARLEKMCSYHTVQVGPGDRGRKKSKKRNGFDLDLIRVEIGILKNNFFLRNEL